MVGKVQFGKQNDILQEKHWWRFTSRNADGD